MTTKFDHQMQQFFTTEISVNFNLRQTRKNKPTIVYCVILFNSKRIRINTLVKVLPRQWNSKKQLAVVSPTLTPRDNQNNIICNNKLSYIRKEIEQKLLSFTNYDTFVADIIRIANPHYHFSMAKKQSKSKVSTQQQASADSTTATYILYTMLKNDSKIGVNSLTKTYRVYLNLLEQFFAKKRIKNELKSLNYGVLRQYAEYLQATQTSSYAKRVFNLLRSWLKKRLTKHGVGYKFDSQIDTISLETTTISASEKGDEYIALTHEQIYKIYNLSDDELKNSTLKLDKLKFYKDIFVMQCMCGCRASDIVKLFDENNINTNNGTPFIEFWAKKTSRREKAEKCVVPFTLYPEQLQFFERYKGVRMYESTFTGDSDNTYNNYIREICRIAGFDKMLKRTVEDVGCKTKKERKHEYERITSTVARHSFITNCVRVFHLTPDDIKHMVGHADTQYINKVYLNLTTTDKADKITRKLKQKEKEKENTVTVVPQPQVKGVQTTLINSLTEGQRVLTMLGIEDAIDYDNIDDILTLLCHKEYELKQQYGDKLLRGNIKQVFNSYATTAERKKALQELIDEIQKDD